MYVSVSSQTVCVIMDAVTHTLFVSSALQSRVRTGGGRPNARTSGRELMRRRLSTAEMALRAVADVGFSRIVSIVIESCVGKDTYRTQ
jgi:hypothetical protein